TRRTTVGQDTDRSRPGHWRARESSRQTSSSAARLALPYAAPRHPESKLSTGPGDNPAGGVQDTPPSCAQPGYAPGDNSRTAPTNRHVTRDDTIYTQWTKNGGQVSQVASDLHCANLTRQPSTQY